MFVVKFLFLKHICVVGLMFVRCSNSKCKRCFLWLHNIPSAIILRLIELLGVGLRRSIPRETRERRKDVWKVFFFSLPGPRRRSAFFLKGMKILDFSFLLFVLTNKNLCLKCCVVFYFLWFLDRRTIPVSILTFINWPQSDPPLGTESLLQFLTQDVQCLISHHSTRCYRATILQRLT